MGEHREDFTHRYPYEGKKVVLGSDSNSVRLADELDADAFGVIAPPVDWTIMSADDIAMWTAPGHVSVAAYNSRDPNLRSLFELEPTPQPDVNWSP